MPPNIQNTRLAFLQNSILPSIWPPNWVKINFWTNQLTMTCNTHFPGTGDVSVVILQNGLRSEIKMTASMANEIDNI